MTGEQKKWTDDERAKAIFELRMLLAQHVACMTGAARCSLAFLSDTIAGDKTPDVAAAWLQTRRPEKSNRELIADLDTCVQAITEYVELIQDQLTKEPTK